MNPPDTSVLTGAIWAHFSFSLILAVGGLLMQRGRRYRQWTTDGPTYESLGWVALLSGLLGFGLLSFSDVATRSWAALLGRLAIPSIALSHAVPLALSADLASLTYVIWLTGGSRHSPFKELYFFLPVLAIFLHLPVAFVTSFAVAVAICFAVTLAVHHALHESESLHPNLKLIFALVTLLAFAVTSFIGIALGYAR